MFHFALAERRSRFVSLLLQSIVLLMMLSGPACATETGGSKGPEQAVHLLDYIGTDYAGAVHNGNVIAQTEYAEQLEFAAQVGAIVAALPAAPHRDALGADAAALQAAILGKQSASDVSALTLRMRNALVSAYGIAVAPKRTPDLARGALLYSENCAGCHGSSGRGDGLMAAKLDPKPSDFHLRERQDQRSVYGLYSTIGLGVPGTAMSAFTQLSDSDRWALAFYVSRFQASDVERQRGAELWQAGQRSAVPDLRSLTTLTPAAARSRAGDDGVALLALLRAEPRRLEVSKSGARQTPIAFSLSMLATSVQTYRNGNAPLAQEQAITAYLEGFELVESGLAARSPDLKQTIERDMLAYRNALKNGLPVAEVEQQAERIAQLLQAAEEKLGNQEEANGTNFFSAFVILLREGLEAILVLAGVIAFLTRTGQKAALRYVHSGWIAALALGAVTWYIASYAVRISGASREVTEGVTALVSAAVLLYVGFWLHGKMYAKRWKAFIDTQVRGALNGSTVWALALVSFFAVYREIFETVLFYQALWVQAGADGHGAILAGLGCALAALLVIAWLIFRYSIRLPLPLFFGASSAMLAVLAVVFGGKGIAALQEAGKLPIDPVTFPQIPMLGIFPNWQALATQLLLLMLILGGFAYSHYNARREHVAVV